MDSYRPGAGEDAVTIPAHHCTWFSRTVSADLLANKLHLLSRRRHGIELRFRQDPLHRSGCGRIQGISQFCIDTRYRNKTRACPLYLGSHGKRREYTATIGPCRMAYPGSIPRRGCGVVAGESTRLLTHILLCQCQKCRQSHVVLLQRLLQNGGDLRVPLSFRLPSFYTTFLHRFSVAASSKYPHRRVTRTAVIRKIFLIITHYH